MKLKIESDMFPHSYEQTRQILEEKLHGQAYGIQSLSSTDEYFHYWAYRVGSDIKVQISVSRIRTNDSPLLGSYWEVRMRQFTGWEDQEIGGWRFVGPLY